MFKEAFTVRDKIKNNPYLAAWCKQLKDKANKCLYTKISEYTREEYNQFYISGNTLNFGKKYFDRRARLACYSMMVFIYRDKNFIKPLEEIIEIICDEFTWVLPEHIDKDNNDYKGFIDLFAAETGLALSEIKYLLSDELSDTIKERISSEVRKRIITPYLDSNREFSWYTRTNNWAAVCSGSCACMAMYEGTNNEAENAIAKTEKIMKNFLSGFSDEGICLEGYAYWTYGFGFFTVYADLVKSYTKGAVNHFENKRVKQIASFVNNGIIRDGTQLTFSDASPTENSVSMGLEFFYSALYDDIHISGSGWQNFGSDSSYRFVLIDRTFIWTTMYMDKVTKNQNPTKSVLFYPNAQWYIKKTPVYILCAKGGNNGESHNHNDLGSFYIDNYSHQLIADIGSGEYTEKYFSDKRYDLLVCGSQGHNLPIINNSYQSEGSQYHASVLKADDNCFLAELSYAYNIKELDSFTRNIEPKKNCILLTDCFKGDFSSIIERFISLIQPAVTKNGIEIKNASLQSDLKAEVTKTYFSNHKGIDQEVWLIDYKKTGNFKNYTFTLTINFKE